FSSFFTSAQTKRYFFDRFYFSAMTGNTAYKTDLNEWKNMYQDRTAIPYFLDTMKEAFIAKDGIFIDFNGKGAASLSAGKKLTGMGKKFWRKRELEWRTGIHFKTTRNLPSREGYTDMVY